MSEKTSAWADKATLDDIAKHIAANGSSAIGHRLLEIAREQADAGIRWRRWGRALQSLVVATMGEEVTE